MLGAQARAAELAAASAAKQRQASRELEDQQSPPATTVPLSAYTKPQQIASRNKGNKIWKPLILDNIDEAVDDSSVPAAPAVTPEDRAPMTEREISDKGVPSAPRAMVVERENKKTFSAAVALPLNPKTDFKPAGYVDSRKIPSAWDSHKNVSGPRKAYEPDTFSTQPSFQGVMFSNGYNQYPVHGEAMVPEDISPAKQEERYHMLGGPFMAQAYQGLDQSQQYLQSAYAHDGFATYDNIRQNEHAHEYGWGKNQDETTAHGYGIPWHNNSHLAHALYDHDGAHDYSGGFAGQVEDPSHGYAQQSIYTPAVAPLSRRDMRRSSLQFLPRTAARPSAEPYDTEQAMKDCVNKLREQAKDGKTVLYNPDSRKDTQRTQSTSDQTDEWTNKPEKSFSRPVPWEVQSKEEAGTKLRADSNAGQRVSSLDSKRYLADQVPAVKPAPGLPLPKAFGHRIQSLDEGQAGHDNDVAPVGSEAWMRLAPISIKERIRVRNCLMMAPGTMATGKETEKTEKSKSGKNNFQSSSDWFYNDGRGEQDLRQQVEILAKSYAAKATTSFKAQNGGALPKSFQDGKDDGMAANLILGNIACNLQTYLVGDPRSVEQRQNFHKVKAVPDWCAENVPAHGRGESFFDGATGGFIGAPVRVARDPRFRPQLKEGTKLKADEEWKNRHEMYGRRVM